MQTSKQIGLRPKTSFMIEFLCNYRGIEKGTQAEVYIDPTEKGFLVYKKSTSGNQFFISGWETTILNIIKFIKE